MTEHETIWLQPWCEGCERYRSSEGRNWCEDDLWGTCDECGNPSVQFVLAAQPRSAKAPDLVHTAIYEFQDLPVGRWSVHGKAEIVFDGGCKPVWEVGHILSAVADDGTPMPKTDVAAALQREHRQYIQDMVDNIFFYEG